MLSKESDSRETFAKPAELSEGMYVGGALTIVGVGFLGAVQYSMKKDREVFKKKKVPTLLAAKAIAYATLLCVGSFAGLTALMVFTTGISNTKDFGRAMRKLMGNKIPEEEFQKDQEIEFENMSKEIVEFLIANDETNQAKELLTKKPEAELVVETENKPPRESPLLALFKESNGEYSKKSPILAWLREKRAQLLGEPLAKESEGEVKVDPVVVKEIIEAALKDTSESLALTDAVSSQSVDSTVVGRSWMQFWSDTVYGTNGSSSESVANK